MKKGKKEPKVNGRPREHDRDQIAADIVEWAKKETSINPNEFCAEYHHPFSIKKLSLWSIEDPIFRESYDICKSYLACRREKLAMKGEMPSHVYALNAPVYDYLIKEEKQAQIRFEFEIKSQTESKHSEEEIERHNSLMNQIKKLQTESTTAKSTQ